MATRVLILTPIYPWPGDPYEGIFVHRQVVNLARQGVQCRVLTYRPAPPGLPRWLAPWSAWRHGRRWLARARQVDGIPIDHVFFPQRWNRREDRVPAIAEALVRHIERRSEYAGTDVVYAHWLWTGGAAALALRERFGWPVAAIARGSEMHFWHTIHPHCRPWVERVLREADLALANCDGLRRRTDSFVAGAAAGVRVVYNGCDTERFSPAADRDAVRRTLGLDPDARLLLCCAGITERKGIAELAEVWREFSPGHPEWRLVLIGRLAEPALLQQLQQVANGRLRYDGAVPHERVALYMQAADAYIQPSRLEGLANATMEAMSTGLPVVVTDTHGQAELVRNGENGWMVTPGDAMAMARALDSLASDPGEARRRGTSARQTIEQRFDPHPQARRLASLLSAVASGRRPRGAARKAAPHA